MVLSVSDKVKCIDCYWYDEDAGKCSNNFSDFNKQIMDEESWCYLFSDKDIPEPFSIVSFPDQLFW